MNQKVHARTARDSIIRSPALTVVSFLRTTDELIRDAIREDKEEVNRMKQELSLIEEGGLRVRKVDGRFYYGCYDSSKKKETGISRDMDRVHELARKGYLGSRISMIEGVIRHYENLLDSLEFLNKKFWSDSRLKRFAGSGLDLTRILLTKEQNEWLDEQYTPNPYHLENLTSPTKGGVMMRSKSEAGIGSELELIGWPYRYDDLVVIKYDQWQGRPFRESYFIDFKVPNLSGGITEHEHFGALHIEQYPDNSLKKLNDYHNFEVYELPGQPVRHEEFTWSFEHDLQSQDARGRLIRRMLLPGTSL